MRTWCAAFTKPRQEEVASENLTRQGFRTYLPRLKQPKRRRDRWIEVIEPLFPRYLFVELDLRRTRHLPDPLDPRGRRSGAFWPEAGDGAEGVRRVPDGGRGSGVRPAT